MGFKKLLNIIQKMMLKEFRVNDANNLLDKSYPETLITKTWHQAMSH